MKDLGNTIQQFELLLKDDASKMAPLTIQEAQAHLLGLLKKVQSEKPDHPKGQIMQLVQTIWLTFQHFLKHDEEGVKLSGAKAMKAICERNTALFKKKELDHSHMQPIKQFSWLVGSDFAMRVKTLGCQHQGQPESEGRDGGQEGSQDGWRWSPHGCSGHVRLVGRIAGHHMGGGW